MSDILLSHQVEYVKHEADYNRTSIEAVESKPSSNMIRACSCWMLHVVHDISIRYYPAIKLCRAMFKVQISVMLASHFQAMVVPGCTASPLGSNKMRELGSLSLLEIFNSC
jgi:uncharacterized protein YbbC (DUF1343 family)